VQGSGIGMWYVLTSSFRLPLIKQAVWKEPSDWIKDTRGRGIVQCAFILVHLRMVLTVSRQIADTSNAAFGTSRLYEVPITSRHIPYLIQCPRYPGQYTVRVKSERCPHSFLLLRFILPKSRFTSHRQLGLYEPNQDGYVESRKS